MSLIGRDKRAVTGSSAWRDESWGDCERWPVTVLMWRAAEDRSRHEGQRPERLDHRRLTAAYGGQSATVTRQNVDDVEPRCLLAGRVRRRGTMVLPPCPQTIRQLVIAPLRRLQSVQLTEEWSGVLVPRRGKHQPSSRVHRSPTEAASTGTAGCRRARFMCRSVH